MATPPRWIFQAAALIAWASPGCGALADDALDAAAATACSPNQPGLVISEIMPNPTGPDLGHEWLEIYNSGAQPLCLDGAVLHVGAPWAPKQRPLRHIGCLAPGALWLLADGTHRPGDVMEPGAACAPHYRYGAMVMPNDRGTVAISCGGQVLDAVEYGPQAEAPMPQPGRALARVPMAPFAPFCSVSGPADGRGDVGSPGTANPGCSTCQEGLGPVRLRRPPRPGALAVTAYRALASEPQGGGGLWAELTLMAHHSAPDLAGLRVEAIAPGRRARSWQVPEDLCQALEPGVPTTLGLTGAAHVPAFGPRAVGRRPPPKGPMTLRLMDGDTCVAEVGVPLGAEPPAGGPAASPPCY